MRNMLDSVIKQLHLLAHQNQCMSYQDFARKLAITKAPIIAQVTELLEQSMEQDVQTGRPVFAVLVVQKNGSLPRQGFFQKLHQLGKTPMELRGEDAEQWHQQERQKIQQWIMQHDQ